jgi:hypothetical protein
MLDKTMPDRWSPYLFAAASGAGAEAAVGQRALLDLAVLAIAL